MSSSCVVPFPLNFNLPPLVNFLSRLKGRRGLLRFCDAVLMLEWDIDPVPGLN